MADDIELFIAETKASGGGERANYQIFVQRLTQLIGVEAPTFSREENWLNDYVFERRLDYTHPDGSTTPLYADCYRRGSFVLEAKQSARREVRDASELMLFPEETTQRRLGHARRGSAGWDRVMRNAYHQAVDYTRHLPVEHGYPPFVLVVDVGNVIEVYADFSGQGKNYAQFPDRHSYRITMDDLRREEVRSRLRAIWNDPHSLDPAKRSAEVTRDIAGRLGIIAKRLERKHDPQEVAEFLMRCLFTMFAEDVGLLPKAEFANLLKDLVGRPETFPVALESLWRTMDEGGYEPRMMVSFRRFNGSLFKKRRALPLAPEDINELHIAAKQDWSDVEPAIFGTLLERALNPAERSKLGAHYTPRAYVERLVIPTIIEPLRAEWEEVQALVLDLRRDHREREALDAVRSFHHRLCTTRVLDPACGTGNFLYIALELMKKLEGEVLVALDELGEDEGRFAMEGETVSPRQFYGLEINPRAVPIADLVLWIGYLKWQLRTVGVDKISEPVLDAYGTIRHQDAILAHDGEELVRDERGVPMTRWDGVSMKRHPITGELVPDPEGAVEVYRYRNPRPAAWPEVEFIVGNPPFIGGKDMRAGLGDGYAEAAWKARPAIPGGSDFVMHFWDEAATRLVRPAPNPLRRFGFITTNSITQTFSRRVIERHISAKAPLSLVYAIADHPWMKASDKAAVRIAMTVAEKGERDGVLAAVVSEAELGTDAPVVGLAKSEGRIGVALRLGANISSARMLRSNSAIASPGVKLHGAGFIVTPTQATALGLGRVSGLETHIVDYRNGRDIAGRPRGVKVIDLYPLEIDEVRERFPAVYQHLLETVKPERDLNNRTSYREAWWIFGEPRKEWRAASKDLPTYIATTETAKHRVFQFLDSGTRPDNMLVNIAVSAPRHLAVLSSRVHVAWALAAGGTLEDRPRYNKVRTFDPFPFPAFDAPSVKSGLDRLGERLDAFRRERMLQHDFLTMTGMYNVLERVRELESGASVEPLNDKERAIHEAGLISVLKEIHDDIDRAVLEAYGWGDLIPDLIGKPGATTPSVHKSPEQEAAEELLLSRLVSLNQERTAEEARGVVRWLRPEYQVERLGATMPLPEGEQLEVDIVPLDKAAVAKWPTDAFAQIRIVRDVLAKAPAPMPVEGIAIALHGLTKKRRDRVQQVVETLVATGAARLDERGAGYFVPR